MMQVVVRTHARLHFGFLDLSGKGGPRVGGMGLTIARPRCTVLMRSAQGLTVEGEQAERAEVIAARVHEALEITPRARIEIVEAIPQHVGLGSGTQLELALASGISSLNGLELPVAQLTALLGRSRRSGVGLHLFRRGGFVVEGGHAGEPRRSDPEPPPLLARHRFPKEWRVLVAIPALSRSGGNGVEDEAFSRMRPGGEATVERTAGIILTRLLPAIAEKDFPGFAGALVEAHEASGAFFDDLEQAEFHSGGALLVRHLKEAGGRGVGQSSWGPAVYAFAENDVECGRLADAVRGVDPDATLITTRGWNRGASVVTPD